MPNPRLGFIAVGQPVPQNHGITKLRVSRAGSKLAMPPYSADPITELIEAAQGGRQAAWDQVYALLYDDLHSAARQQIRHWRGEGRSATSLINRAWLRVDMARLTFESRRHLIGVMVRAMRFALLDEARRLEAFGRQPVPLSLDEIQGDLHLCHDPKFEQLLALDVALDALTATDPRLGLLVEMRYFADMTDVEIAQVLGLSDRTVRRDWRKAQAFLAAHLGADTALGSDGP